MLIIRKANGGNNKIKGTTRWDAIRLIQNDNGLFLKLNDPTFSRTRLDNQPETARNYIHYTLAYDCTNQNAVSRANLSRTNLKFSTLVLPYRIRGNSASGAGALSSNNQILTVTVKGWCSHAYFVSIYSIPMGDGNSITGQHLLPVTF